MSLSFNLLDEPWIRVRDGQGNMDELSLTDTLVKAHRYVALAGESPAQDAAVLRLLIAIVHTIFYRVDENGNKSDLEDDKKGALKRWKILWQMRERGLPEAPIREYLAKWRDRFDLLDEKYPFYQTPAAKIGTDFAAGKLNGAILESGNKVRIFANRTEENRNFLSFAEAVRWLLYLQGFDDASPKPKTEMGKKNNKRPEIDKNKAVKKTAWMGNLGLIYAAGITLSETILLNLAFLKEGKKPYDPPKPCWEREDGPETEERRLNIPFPNNIPELFTIQSRRILLRSDGNRIVGYNEYVGDLLNNSDAFAEPMTLWARFQEKKGSIPYFSPRKHDPSKQLWRDFSSLVIQSEDKRLPGIIYWLQTLEDLDDCLDDDLIRFNSVAILYDSKGFSVTNTVSDSLSFHAALLSKLGDEWRKLIDKQIELCDDIAEALAYLAGSIALAAGKRELKNGNPVKYPLSMQDAERVKSQFYFHIDADFRRWLLLPDVGQGAAERDKLCEVWNETAVRAAFKLGRSIIEEVGTTALLSGRQIDDKHYSAAEAYYSFSRRINGLKTKKEEQVNGG